MRQSYFLSALLLLLAVPFPAAGVTPQEIQERVRYSQALQDVTMKGLLKSDTLKKRIPFSLTIRGGDVGFAFATETITLQRESGGYQLSRTAGGKTEGVPPTDYGKGVSGTDVTYEDLSMRFLYWPKAKIEETVVIKGRKAWKLHIASTTYKSSYSQVFIWVDQASGGLLKFEGYDWDGRRVKMYEVVSGQKIQGAWMIKKMNVESYNPENGKRTGRTTLQLKEP